MAYTRRFTTPSSGSFNITTALQTPEFQQYLLSQAGQEPEKKKAGFFDRLFRLMDTFTWTDEAYDAKRLGLTGGQALGRYLMDIPKTLNVLNPWATKEDLQKDLGKGKEFAKLQGMSNPGLSGFLMDVLDPSLLVSGVVKSAVGAGSKGLSTVGKEFVEKGAKELGEEIAKKGTKEASEKVLSYVGKELGENAAKSAAARVATGEGIESILTDVVKTFGDDAFKNLTQPGLKIAGKMVLPGKNAGRLGRFIENPLVGGAEGAWTGLGRLPGGKTIQGVGTQAVEPFRELLSFGRAAEKAGAKPLAQKLRLGKRSAQLTGEEKLFSQLGQAISEGGGAIGDSNTQDLIEIVGGLYERQPKNFMTDLVGQGVLNRKQADKILKAFVNKGDDLSMLNMKLMQLSQNAPNYQKAARDAVSSFVRTKNAKYELLDAFKKGVFGDNKAVLQKFDEFVKMAQNAPIKEGFDPDIFKADVDEIINLIKSSGTNLTPGQVEASTAWLEAIKTNADMGNIYKDLNRSWTGLGYTPHLIEGKDIVKTAKKRTYKTIGEAQEAGKVISSSPENVVKSLYSAYKDQAMAIQEHAAHTDFVSRIREGLMPDVAKVIKEGDEIPEGFVSLATDSGTGLFNGPMYKDIVFSEETAKVMKNLNSVLYGNKTTQSQLGKMFEKVSGIWRGMQTGANVPGVKIKGIKFPLFPAFHIRNKTNNILESMIRGEMGFSDVVKYQKDAADIGNYLTGLLDPSKDVTELGQKLIDGRKIEDIVKEVKASGILGGGSHIDEATELLSSTPSKGMLGKIQESLLPSDKVTRASALLDEGGDSFITKASDFIPDEITPEEAARMARAMKMSASSSQKAAGQSVEELGGKLVGTGLGIDHADDRIDAIETLLRGDRTPDGLSELQKILKELKGANPQDAAQVEIAVKAYADELAAKMFGGAPEVTQEVVEKGAKEGVKDLSKDLSKIVKEEDLGRVIENGDRIALYLFHRNQGKTMEEARDIVAKVLFDYSELTPFERSTLRPLASFYTWTKKNIEGYAKLLNEDPTRLKMVSKLMEGIKNGGNLSEEERAALPDWMQESLAIYTGRQGNSLGFLTGLGSSMDAIAGLAGEGGADTGMNILGMMNPVLSLPLQATLDQNFFKGKPISEDTTGYQYQNMPDPIKELLGFREEKYFGSDGQINTTYKVDPWKKFWLEGVIGRLMTSSGKISNIAAGDEDVYGVLNLLTGVRYQQRDMDWEVEQRRRELQEELDKQLVEAGLATPKSGVYMNKSAYLNYPSLKGSLKSEFGYNPKEQSVSDKLKASEEKSKDQAYIEQLINQVQTN